VPIPARPLRECDLASSWNEQFEQWFDDAAAHGQLQPEAMVVATATADARPSVRMVLLRGVDARGFCFFTDYGSRKAGELEENPFAAVAFHWPSVLRQVRATGAVERVTGAESDAYWAARPRGSRISATASAQSRAVGSRDELEAAVTDVERRFVEGDVPRPDDWGGYRVVPDEVEFWQHRDDRLHDRLVYRRFADGWTVTRLQP
jgi:pyridoxamine 5'-phosphate oxidase